MRTLLKILILPPGSLFCLAICGLCLWRWRPRLGRALVATSGLLGYLLCTPLVAALLLRSLEVYPALDPARLGEPAVLAGAEAIVVLAGDIEVQAPEYRGSDQSATWPEGVGETLGELTLQRLRYGAWLQRATGLPLAVTGGRLRHGTEPVAEIMRRALVAELGVEVEWVEARAATTWENAGNLARLLERERGQLPCVLLVTHAWHMPRAVQSFEAAGFSVVAAPTDFRPAPRLELGELLPSAKALGESAFALHEWIGRAWYALRAGPWALLEQPPSILSDVLEACMVSGARAG